MRAPHPALLALRTQIQAGLDAAQRDKTLLDRVVDDPLGRRPTTWTARSRTTTTPRPSARPGSIGQPERRPRRERDSRLAVPSVALALATALDDWAAICRSKRRDPGGAPALIEAARVADPDPWRNALRDSSRSYPTRLEQQALQALAQGGEVRGTGPDQPAIAGLRLMQEAGRSHGGRVGAAEGPAAHPVMSGSTTSWGRCWRSRDRPDEAIRFYTAGTSDPPRNRPRAGPCPGEAGRF